MWDDIIVGWFKHVSKPLKQMHLVCHDQFDLPKLYINLFKLWILEIVYGNYFIIFWMNREHAA